MSKKLGLDVNVAIGEAPDSNVKSTSERNAAGENAIKNYPENTESIPVPEDEMLKKPEIETAYFAHTVKSALFPNSKL